MLLCGKYLAIFATIKSKGSRNITTVQRAGQLLYLTVPGSLSKKGQVLDFNMPGVIFSRLVPWSFRIHSSGNVHFTSRVSGQIKPLVGRADSSLATSHLILPQVVRLVDGHLSVSKLPGIYKAHFLIGQGDSPAYQTTRLVVYTPPWLLLGLGLLCLLWLLRFIRK